MRQRDYPGNAEVPLRTTHFDLDTNGRLVRIHVPENDHDTRFDLAPASTAELSYVNSFANGSWILESVDIDSKGNLDTFNPQSVIERSRAIAFATAEARRRESVKEASTEEGRRKIERRVQEAQGTGLSQSTKRFALILTGLIVIAVGSLAWWKNRS